MTAIRTKDKIFLAVVVPLAIVGAYVFGLAMPAQKRIAALREQHRVLPDVDMFPTEKRTLQRKVAETEKELAAEKAVKPPEMSVKGDPAAMVAVRQDAVLAMLTAAGVQVVKVQPVATDGEGGARGRAVLAATERCPAPEARVFTVEADYASLVAALKAFADRQAPVVPESISLRVGGRTCRWEMTLWL